MAERRALNLSTLPVDRAQATPQALGARTGKMGFGFIDYSDTDAPSALILPAGVQTHVARSLTASANNSRLQSVFAGHAFWDNAGHLIRPRGLYDILYVSMYIKVVPGASNGVLDVTLMAGSVDIGTKSFPMTGAVGTDQGLRADFIVPARPMFVANGAKVMLTASVTTNVTEFSPEFYPLGYEA